MRDPRSDSNLCSRRGFVTAAGVGAMAAVGAPAAAVAGPQGGPERGRVRMDPLIPLACCPGDWAPGFADPSQTGRSWAEVRWNEAANRVQWRVHYDCLPYRPTVERPAASDPHLQSGDFFPAFPNLVEEGVYQFWMVSMNPVIQICYYDPVTLDFLGTPRTLEELPPIEEAVVTNEPEIILACSPLAEPDPKTGELNFRWEHDYDRVLDAAGNGGMASLFTPMNLKNAGERAAVAAIVPPEEALPFSFWHQGNGLAFDTTIEPDPKPPELTSYFNPIVIQGQIGNNPLPPGLTVDLGVTYQVYPLPELPYAHPLIYGVPACD